MCADDNKGVDLVYEEDSPCKSYHCTISYSESISPLCDLENRLLVTEEKIVKVLMRVDGSHKFIEDIMWKNLDGGETKRSCKGNQ
jgi:hypothetical protein